jgi:hypothetical protein
MCWINKERQFGDAELSLLIPFSFLKDPKWMSAEEIEGTYRRMLQPDYAGRSPTYDNQPTTDSSSAHPFRIF